MGNEPNSIKCPRCEGDIFQAKTYTKLTIVADQVKPIGITQKTIHVCNKCGHPVAEPADLETVTITVHIVGNSHSYVRSGVNKALGGRLIEYGPKKRSLIQGQLLKNGYAKIDDQVWFFTSDGWSRHINNREFELSERPHSVKELHYT